MALGRRGDVIGVAGHAVSRHLGVNLRAALLRVLIFLQHDAAGALAHHESVAILVPGTRRGAGPVVEAGGQGAGSAESGDADLAHRGLRAAGQHHVGVAQPDQPRRIADRMHPGRAGRHHRMVRAFEAVFDRQMPGREIAERRRNEERRQPPRLAFVDKDGGLIDCLQAADAGADHHAGGAAIVLGFRHPAGILDRLGARDHRQMDEAIHLLLVLDRDPLVDIQSAGVLLPAGT